VKTIRILATASLGALMALGISTPLMAQENPSNPAQGLEESLSTRASDLESERSTLLKFLEREDVQATAQQHGIDMEEVRSAVRTMDSEQLQGVTKQLQNSDDFIAGGDRIVIASSTIIIILLILILVAVA